MTPILLPCLFMAACSIAIMSSAILITWLMDKPKGNANHDTR